MKKRVLSLLLALVLLAALLPQTALTTHAATSGSCGESLTWSFNESTGKLTIEGSGKMEYDSCPWYSCRKKITSVSLPEGLTSISESAFEECTSLTSVTIPDSVTSIGFYAFARCTSLTSAATGNGITCILGGMFLLCRSLQKVSIGSNVTKIENSAFNGCTSLTSVIIPDGVTDIGREAFKSCISLTAVTIPDTVTSIGGYAFNDCSSLKRVTIPDSVTFIGEVAFGSCSALTSVTIPDSVTSIGRHAFQECTALKSVTIGSGVTEIGTYAFSSCESLTKITVAPGNPKYSNDSSGVLFNKNKTKLIRCPGGLTGSYTIPSGVTSIDGGAFNGCGHLTDVTIPDGVKSIGERMFFDCESLTSVTIPNSVTSIGEYAFYGCATLMNIVIPKKVVSIGSWAFDECSDDLVIYSAAGSAAETFAKDYGITFKSALDAPVVTASNNAATGKVKLTWTAVPLAESYEVYRAEAKDGPYKLMKTVTDDAAYTNTGAVAGEKYWYKVKAVNGSLGGKYSAVKSRTCDLPRPVVTASNVADSGKIKLTWKAVDGAVGYKVYRAESKDGPYKLMKTVTDGLSYTNTSVEAGQKYWYKVKAIHANTSANSAYSTVKSRTCDLPRPVVSITRTAAGKPKLTWKKVAGAVSYKVYRCETKTGTYKLMKTVTDGLSYTNTSAEKGKTYYYKVKAVHKNADALSAFSLVKSITAK